MATLQVEGEEGDATEDLGAWTPLGQAARLRLLHLAGPGPDPLAALVPGLGGSTATLECSEEEVVGWTRVLTSGQATFPSLAITWRPSLPTLPLTTLAALLEAASPTLTSLTLCLDLRAPPPTGEQVQEQVLQVRSRSSCSCRWCRWRPSWVW